MKKRITSLSELAQHLGLSRSTVSLALSGKGTISAATRARVREAAERYGYRPNPLLSAAGRPKIDRSSGREDPERRLIGGTPVAYLFRHLEGKKIGLAPEILRLAEPFGIRVTNFDLGEQPCHELGKTLYNRGFEGIILGPVSGPMDDFPLDRFSVVRMGARAPRAGIFDDFDMISGAPFQGVLESWRRARERGYRRIGLGPVRHTHETIYDDLARRGAALVMLEETDDEDRIPPCPAVLKDREGYRAWMREHRPEAVIGFNDEYARQLLEDGWRIPEDVAWVSLHATPGYYIQSSGFREHQGRVFEAAVRRVAELIRGKGKGRLPGGGATIRMTDEWIEGRTLPEKAGSASTALDGEE